MCSVISLGLMLVELTVFMSSPLMFPSSNRLSVPNTLEGRIDLRHNLLTNSAYMLSLLDLL